MHGSKRILIVSHGPVPTPEHPHVEGGGLRSWGLGRGLKRNSRNLDITIAFAEGYKKPNHTSLIDGIQITTWSLPTLAEFAADFDTVIVSYCMGDVSATLARSLRDDQQLVLDCYVPIFIEVSARDSVDVEREYAAFKTESESWTGTLRRGDFFLCANREQDRYYQGVLSALGRINPITYGKPMILQVPYGIHREEAVARDQPITRLIGDATARKILWFGGLYPWFDARGLVDAIALVNQSLPVRLIMVGTRNPFTCHPDFLANYEEQIAYARRPEHEHLVFFREWVDFNDRADWYLDADIIVMINKPGDENSLSWRTRLVDYTWANVPIAINGGDPLGEDLLAAGAAARLESLEPAEMARTLRTLLENPEKLQSIRRNLASFRERLYWDTLTEPLARVILEGRVAADLANDRERARELPTSLAPVRKPRRSMAMIHRLAQLAVRFPRHLRQHGVKATATNISERVQRRIGRSQPKKEPAKPRVVVMAHQLDLSGAPYILMDVVAHLAERGLRKELRVFSHQPVHKANIKQLSNAGIKISMLPYPDAVPPMNEGDVFLLNTAAFSPAARAALFDALERGVIKKLIWYLHENEPERYFTPAETIRISGLIANDRITMYIPSKRTLARYERHFQAEMRSERYHIELPLEYHKVRTADDFDRLDFIMPGTFIDGRKSQHVVLYALAAFYRHFFLADRASYREFSLTFVGAEDDWYSRQLVSHKDVLGNRLRVHPKLTRERCLDLIREANITVCYSQSETLPVFVFEGMLSGHPLLRNDCSGVDEQLEDGGNGYRLDSADFWQVVETFECVLNRRKTSNERLSAMSARSYAIGIEQSHYRYDDLIDEIETIFRGNEPRQASHRPHSIKRPIRAEAFATR
jgi:glycosyltransferase involved in cell wall biosynthesis